MWSYKHGVGKISFYYRMMSCMLTSFIFGVNMQKKKKEEKVLIMVWAKTHDTSVSSHESSLPL
jgi:hypothetical protein